MKTGRMHRLFRPRSIAVIGGGFWGRNVIKQCAKMGFDGKVWPVHATQETLEGLLAFRRVEDLPGAPDAAFVGVNRKTTIDIIASLSTIGAGGAVCFASGFSEAVQELGDGPELQSALLAAAGEMPFLGPNCYGFINYLDGVLLWPDQHGGKPQNVGVGLVTQSSNMAISLTMQQRGLPIAYIATAGNQAQMGLADIGLTMLEDERVTALGLHIEGFGDIRAFEMLAQRASALGKSIVALKVGKSAQARAATVSHTASLAGHEAGARAFLDRLGIAQSQSLPSFLETLKFLHVTGTLPSRRIASVSCSGGEASLIADAAVTRALEFPPLNDGQRKRLHAALGPKVALANPLDYHTYIWTDAKAMTLAFSAISDDAIALTILIVDFPRPDRCSVADWDCAIEAALETRRNTGRPVAMVATLQENLPEDVSEKLIAGGVAPLLGLEEALDAAEAAAWLHGRTLSAPILTGTVAGASATLTEARAKALLAYSGLSVPKGLDVNGLENVGAAADKIGYPVVLKGSGEAHKTEAGLVAVALGDANTVSDAAKTMARSEFYVEEMIAGTVAELLVGVVHDPAHGFVLTLGAGGTMTEVLNDATSLLLPVTADNIRVALATLRCAPVLSGYRGAPAVHVDAVIDAVLAVQAFVTDNPDRVEEIEINPLLCGPERAVAADALLRMIED